ncbi:hypothetical protein D081_0581 [Anaerovibrio sp. JC8]|uniref:acyltransferase family protein n=1 Tax=Anaerovibrio sp. JC8 TaxID=1240085 RepID=UPI000A0BD515|nr:acyltransferase family protein [Anaerovibrio sp. JC8]ORU01133.1 hypothetical protein D081_0581 [Anaerovibrio sp. JC8]
MSSIVSTDKQTRNTLLDLLKGICILAVVFTHFRWSEHDKLLMGFPFELDMAVPLFMLISGYVYALSYERNNIISFKQAYGKNRIIKSLIRYTIPFIIVFIAECLLYVIWHTIDPRYKIPNILYALVTGGWGPGSYYYPLLIQLIFLYPILYFLIKKYSKTGLILALLLNFGWEVSKTILDVSPVLYRLLIFRYILLISFGIYSYLNPNKLSKSSLLPFFIVGIVFIIYTKYLDNQVLFLERWTGTCFIASMYIMPVFYVLVRRNCILKNKFTDIIVRCGQASYNIYLFQMLFYYFFAGLVYQYVSYGVIQLLILFFVPPIIGYVFFTIEDPVTKSIIKKLVK